MKDACYSLYHHYSPKVLSVLDDEWRSDKLDMPDIPVNPNIFPRDEESDQFGEHLRKLEEDQLSWKDLSIQEMVQQAHSTEIGDLLQALKLDFRPALI